MNNQIQALSHNVEGEDQKEVFDGLLEIVNEYISIEDIIENNEYAEVKENGNEVEFIKKINKEKDINNIRDLKRFLVKYKNVITENIREKTNIDIYECYDIEGYLDKLYELVGYRNKVLYQNIETINNKETDKKVDGMMKGIKNKILEKLNNTDKDKVSKLLKILTEKEEIKGTLLNIKHVNLILKIAKKTDYKFIDFYILIFKNISFENLKKLEKNVIIFLLGEDITVDCIVKIEINTILYIGEHGLDLKYYHLNKFIHYIRYRDYDDGILDLEKLDVIYKALCGEDISRLIKNKDNYENVLGIEIKKINKYNIKYIVNNGIYSNTLWKLDFIDKENRIHLFENLSMNSTFEYLLENCGDELFGIFLSVYESSIFLKYLLDSKICDMSDIYSLSYDQLIYFLKLDFNNTKLKQILIKSGYRFSKFLKEESGIGILNDYLDGKLKKPFLLRSIGEWEKEYTVEEFVEKYIIK